MRILKKKNLLTLISVLAVACSQQIGQAAEINNVSLSDFDNSILTVSGTGEEASVTVYAIPQGEALKPGIYDDTFEWSVQHAKTVDGEFSVSFKLKGKEGYYDFYVTGAEQPYSFEYISKDTIYNFVDSLGEREIEKDKIFELLSKYNANLGADISFADSDSKKAYVSENFWRYSDIIKEKKLSAIKEIADLSKYELEFMSNIGETEVYSSVNNLLKEYCEKANIKLDDYNKLTDYQKQAVCKGFIKGAYSDMEVFREDFEKSVEDNKNLQKPGSGSSSSSGGTGSSGGSGKNTSSGSALPIITPVEKVEKEDKGAELFDKYDDLESVSWAWDAILYMHEKNIMNGVGEKTFAPDNKLTREQLAKIVVTAFDCYSEGEAFCYSDIPKGSWAESYIFSAKENGLMIGISDELFGYGKEMTRQDLCVVVYRAAVKNGIVFESEKNDFADFDEVSDYAKEAVARLGGAGIINGMENGEFAPLQTVTRAQAAKIIYEILNK